MGKKGMVKALLCYNHAKRYYFKGSLLRELSDVSD